MSLVGNLEDLSLGDIMQIISLSQKSGVLALDGEEGSGRIVFRAGLVQAAAVKGGPDDLRALLVGAGLVGESTFDASAARARQLGQPVDVAIGREGGPSPDQIEAVLHESVESAILTMFTWRSGDFSFDVRNDLEPGDPQLLMTTGINAQYLAMEGMRLRDERSRQASDPLADPEVAAASSDSFPSVEDMFGDEPLETEAFLSDDSCDDGGVLDVALEVDDDLSAADILVARVIGAEEQESNAPNELISAALPTGCAPTGAAEGVARAARRSSAAAKICSRATPVVLIDPDVAALEWVKLSLQERFTRIHVFQQAEQGLARIRQYLIRGELPIVLISTATQIDPLSGIHGLADFVARLKAQALRMVVVGLHEEGGVTRPNLSAAFDGVIFRPSRRQLREHRDTLTQAKAQAFGRALDQVLDQRTAHEQSTSGGLPTAKATSLRDLRDATEKLQDASKRGVILPVVLDFALELFERVAILIVREERVFAIAGRGIEALDVDPLDSNPPVPLQGLQPGWIQRVIETGKSYQGPATTPGDRELLVRLGDVRPTASYLGRIAGGGSTIALLYGDQGAGETPLPDTSGLEVVLHHAGMALDRAALERALWKVEGDAEKRR